MVGCNAGEVVEIGGLTSGREYYVAAWYVKDEEDGRASAETRMPYDTWGYYCTLIPTNAAQIADTMAFDPVLAKAADIATKTTTVYLQDTDWNANGIADRTETIKSIIGATESVSPAWDDVDVDGDGIPDYDDDDPVFDNSKNAKENDVMAYVSMKMLVVQIGTTDSETNWVSYVVHDPASEPMAGKVGEGTLTIPRGTAASKLRSLYTTYLYGRKKSSPLGMGVPVSVANGIVRTCEWKDVVLVHHQVYDEFGFNPNTANAFIPTADWVNTKAFSALDKYIVTNYLAAVGALAPDTAWMDWVLNAKRIDFDFDGIGDGWELYTMFGPDGVKPLVKAAKEDVISAWMFDDRTMDPDHDGLANLNEYDNGNKPTDPWNADSDGDGIGDGLAWEYHLKGGDGVGDEDGDGLSNYVEYMLAEVFKLAAFSPDNAFSVNKNVSDYFYPIGQLYVGEVFTDHDRVSDYWESGYFAKKDEVSPYVYDEMLDPDGDGWSNYAEFQVGTDPTKLGSLSVDAIQLDEYPVPTVELKISYNGKQAVADKAVIVKAWSDPTLESVPDAVWTLGGAGKVSVSENGNSNTVTGVKYFGMNPMREMLVHLSPGSVVPDSVKFEFKDLAWVLYNKNTGMGYYNDPITATWNGGIIAQPRNDGSDIGDIVSQDETSKSLGTIDYTTGEMKVDFSAFSDSFAIVGDIAGRVTGDGWYSVYNLQKSYVRVNWQSKLIIGSKMTTYYLSEADPPSASNNSLGHVKEGANTFIAFYDLDGNGNYTAGEPYGCAVGVDVGWNYARAEIELTDTHPISARVCCITGATGGTEGAGAANGELGKSDRQVLWGTEHGDIPPEKILVSQETGGTHMRLRVVRTLIDGEDCEKYNVPAREILNKVVSVDSERYLTEVDFLQNGALDIDWENLAVDLAGSSGSLVVSNVTYRIVMGEGEVLNSETNNCVGAFNRWFDRNQAVPILLADNREVTTVSPTFKWAIPNGLGTYTAFRIIITGNGFAWDSGFQRMPSRIMDDGKDYKCHYEWTAPISVGDMVSNNGRTMRFANNAEYTWTVMVANSRFRSDNFATRYYGPSNVANGSVIRVEAFSTPDFSGGPVSRGYVTNTTDIASTNAITVANATIPCLKAGSYYIRAYIDTQADSAHQDWESWGSYCTRDTTVGTIYTPKSVTVGPGFGLSETIPVYIDDCDTDHDCLPDAWEWKEKGNLTALSATSIDQVVGGFAMKHELTGDVQVRGDMTPGLAVKSSPALAKKSLNVANVAALILDLDEAGGTDEEVGNALAAAQNDVSAEPTAVAITAIALNREAGTVTITAETEGRESDSGSAASHIYRFATDESALVLTLRLWFRPSLDADGWTEIGSTEVTLEKTSGAYTHSLPEGVDLSSGFFKVSLEK